MAQEIARRLIGGRWTTDVADEGGGGGGDVDLTTPVVLDPALGDSALEINAAAGAAANGDSLVVITGDTGGSVYIGAAGDLTADVDSEMTATGHHLSIDGEDLVRAGPVITSLRGISEAGGIQLMIGPPGGEVEVGLKISGPLGGMKIGFFSSSGAEQHAANAPDAANVEELFTSVNAIHAALLAYGLITTS